MLSIRPRFYLNTQYHITLVNIIGAIVFVLKASFNCSVFTKFNLVNLLETPALLSNTFRPRSPRIFVIFDAKFL